MTVETCNMIIEFFFLILLAIIGVSNYSRFSKNESLRYFNMMVLSMMVFITMDMGTYALIGKGKHRVLLLVLWVLVYVDFFTVIYFFNKYMVHFLKENYDIEAKDHSRFILYVAGFLSILWTISAFNGKLYWFDEMLYDHYTPWRNICSVGSFVTLFPIIFIIIKSRKKLGLESTIILLLYPLAPMLARIVQFLSPFAITYPVTCMSILLIHIAINQGLERRYQSQLVEIEKKALEIQESHQKVLVSQIQPHFLYNVLNTICYLCRKDPKAAAETTSDFATYLRMNLNSIAVTMPVPFDEELEHVKTYLALEKRRYGDALKVEYNIHSRSFFIPVLSLQPVVENAVKHGICQKEDGGTIKISTYDKGTHYVIVVADDGVGFNPEERVERDTRSHIGIDNTINRVRDLCGGKVLIESELNKGTTVTISLPKDKNLRRS